MHENWLEERGEQLRSGIQIVTLDPLPGTARTPSMTNFKTQPAYQAPVTSSHSPVMPQVRYAAASSKTQPVTAGAKGDPLYQIRLLLRA